jgi:outer membrane receptor protein involved in Fe transport
VGSAHELLFGFEYGVGTVKIELDVPNDMPSDYDPDQDLTSAKRVVYYDRFSANGRSFFVKDRWKIIEPLTLVVGGRASYGSYLHTSEHEPRLSAEYQATKDTLVTAGWGKYHQFPQGFQVIPGLGNPDLDDVKADHYNLGVVQGLPDGWSAKIDLYYKDLYDLVVPDSSKNYVNNGSGKAYGSELLIKKNRTDAWSGWIAATYSKTERRNDLTGEKFPYSYDQPVVLNVVYEWRFRPKWTFGAKWRYQSGAPYTPVVGAYDYTDTNGTIRKRPIYGELGSARLPEYHRLDLRVARDFVFDTSKMSVFIDIINAYDNKNISGYEYTENYTSKKPVEQLPLMPAFGITAEF